MANYKVVDADRLDADLASVADSIRAKAGTTGQIAFPDGFKSAVEGIQTGGGSGELISGFASGKIPEYDNGYLNSVLLLEFYCTAK